MGKCCADGKWRRAAYDCVCAEHPHRQIGDVHRATFPLTQARLSSENLVHHSAHIASLGNTVAVAAMGRGYMIAFQKRLADPDCDRFLASVEVNEAGNIARLILLVQTLFKLT